MVDVGLDQRGEHDCNPHLVQSHWLTWSNAATTKRFFRSFQQWLVACLGAQLLQPQCHTSRTPLRRFKMFSENRPTSHCDRRTEISASTRRDSSASPQAKQAAAADALQAAGFDVLALRLYPSLFARIVIGS